MSENSFNGSVTISFSGFAEFIIPCCVSKVSTPVLTNRILGLFFCFSILAGSVSFPLSLDAGLAPEVHGRQMWEMVIENGQIYITLFKMRI